MRVIPRGDEERSATGVPRRLSPLRAALRHTSFGQRVRLAWLTSLRTLVGLCDLLLAIQLYSLFLLLQQRAPASSLGWTPRTVAGASVTTMFLVVVRSLLDIGSLRAVVRYTQDLYTDLVTRLARTYTEMRWERFVASNRAELLNTTVHTAREAAMFYHLCVELTACIVVVLAMTAALIYESPAAAAGFAATAALLYGVHRLFVRENLREAGARREDSLRVLQRSLLELFSSRKEVQTYANHDFFYRRILRQTSAVSSASQRLMVLPQIARTLTDQGAVLVFLACIVVVELRHGDIQRTLSVLVFYFVLSRRLLPLVSQISYMASQVEGSYASIELVNRELSTHREEGMRAPPDQLPARGLVLELEEISFRFHAEADVLRGISLRQLRGEVIVLHGRSGSGKSSLLNLIAGVMLPASGAVRIDRSSIAYVPQEIVLLDDSIRSNLLFGLEGASDEALMRALAVAMLDDFVAALPMELETGVGDNGVLFSGGQRQRLGLARAVLRGASLLLLDEATSALEPATEAQVLKNLRTQGIAVFAVTHHLHTRRFADREFQMVDGRLIEVMDGPAQVPYDVPHIPIASA